MHRNIENRSQCGISNPLSVLKLHPLWYRSPPSLVNLSIPIHDTSKYANNRAELSHQPTRVRERGMRRFKSVQQAQRFLNVHAAVYNLFNLGRHLISDKNYRLFRLRAFASWLIAVE